MPDALFHYALLAHMRSSCIRRRLKKSIFPTLPSNYEDARPTGCGAEPRERFLPFLLQNRSFSKEILTFRTPL